jgi:hypothetical protein
LPQSEASARNGSIRYGEAYLGHIVNEYLGGTGTLILALSVAVIRSFTAPSGFLGVLAAPLIGGVFPILLLVASRAKGDRPTRYCYFSAVAERGLLK